MGIALFTTSTLALPLQALFHGCMKAVARRLGLHAQPATRPSPMAVPNPATSARLLPPFHPRPAAARRPLRVVRVVEGARGGRSSGRMVISGRMADVCAELDRLAACEG